MANKTELSFEFFPPKTPAGLETLSAAVKELDVLQPTFYSVTYGAGGGVRDLTLDTIAHLQTISTTPFTPHLSCIASTRAGIQAYLQTSAQMNIKQFVALRGDLPSGAMGRRGEFNYANELIAFMRKHVSPDTIIYAAAYPEMHPDSKTLARDTAFFETKINAGANAAITQYFYNIDAFLDWRDRLWQKNIRIPLIPGIMPITQLAGLQRFSTICGAEIPRWLVNRLEAFADDQESVLQFGIEYMTHFCQRLIQSGVPGLHFYTLNKATASLAICKNLAS